MIDASMSTFLRASAKSATYGGTAQTRNGEQMPLAVAGAALMSSRRGGNTAKRWTDLRVKATTWSTAMRKCAAVMSGREMGPETSPSLPKRTRTGEIGQSAVAAGGVAPDGGTVVAMDTTETDSAETMAALASDEMTIGGITGTTETAEMTEGAETRIGTVIGTGEEMTTSTVGRQFRLRFTGQLSHQLGLHTYTDAISGSCVTSAMASF